MHSQQLDRRRRLVQRPDGGVLQGPWHLRERPGHDRLECGGAHAGEWQWAERGD